MIKTQIIWRLLYKYISTVVVSFNLLTTAIMKLIWIPKFGVYILVTRIGQSLEVYTFLTPQVLCTYPMNVPKSKMYCRSEQSIVSKQHVTHETERSIIEQCF